MNVDAQLEDNTQGSHVMINVMDRHSLIKGRNRMSE